jgi:hypothetical protein
MGISQAFMGDTLFSSIATTEKRVLERQPKITLLFKKCCKTLFRGLVLLKRESIYYYHPIFVSPVPSSCLRAVIGLKAVHGASASKIKGGSTTWAETRKAAQRKNNPQGRRSGNCRASPGTVRLVAILITTPG